MALTVEAASIKVREFFQKIKGDWKVLNKPIIDWLEFNVVKAEEKEDTIVIECEMLESIFSEKKVTYRVELKKDTGDIIKLERIKNESSG